jgi:hypothetical protein
MRYGSLRFSIFTRITSILSIFPTIIILYVVFFALFFDQVRRIPSHSEEISGIDIVVRWDLMSPPELARDTPVTQIIDPVFECLVESLWYDFEFSFLIACCHLLSHSACPYEPLSGYY